MGTKLSPEDTELYKYADEVLFYKWDPLEISNSAGTRDEYNSYLGAVFSMMKQNKTPEDIAAYLTQIETERMGLSTSEGSKKKNLEVAELLLEYLNLVSKKTAY